MQSQLEVGSNCCALLFKTWKGIPNKTPFLLLSPYTWLWMGESPARGKWGCSLSLCAPSGLLQKQEGPEEPCWKLILHSSAFRLPCTPVQAKFSQEAAALLPHWIKAVRHLQGEKWDSGYKFTHQRERKAIGREAANDNTSGQPLVFSVVLCCTKALRTVTVSLQGTWNNVAPIHSCVVLCMLQLYK